MNQNREPISVALFAKLEAGYDWNRKGRRLKLWNELDAADFPAMFLVSHGENVQNQGERLFQSTVLEYGAYIYFSARDENDIPETTLNTLLDAVDLSLRPTTLENVQTLGGLVSHCWIEGEVVKVPGDIDGIGLAIVPIRVLVP